MSCTDSAITTGEPLTITVCCTKLKNALVLSLARPTIARSPFTESADRVMPTTLLLTAETTPLRSWKDVAALDDVLWITISETVIVCTETISENVRLMVAIFISKSYE